MTESQEYIKWLLDPEGGGYSLAYDMGQINPDKEGMWCALRPLMFHWTLHIGVIGDKSGYEDRYCYADFSRALDGVLGWCLNDFKDEPPGWRKHPKSDRCRNDNGDPESETIGWG